MLVLMGSVTNADVWCIWYMYDATTCRVKCRQSFSLSQFLLLASAKTALLAERQDLNPNIAGLNPKMRHYFSSKNVRLLAYIFAVRDP